MRQNSEGSWTDEPAEAGVFQDWRERLACEVPEELLGHPELSEIAVKVAASERLSINDGLTMSSCTDFPALSRLAHISKSARFGDQVFFNRNLHVNQTKIPPLDVEGANSCRDSASVTAGRHHSE
jgi:hypothetical protein